MKKQIRKITLSKETLLKLDNLQGFIVMGRRRRSGSLRGLF